MYEQSGLTLENNNNIIMIDNVLITDNIYIRQINISANELEL